MVHAYIHRNVIHCSQAHTRRTVRTVKAMVKKINTTAIAAVVTVSFVFFHLERLFSLRQNSIYSMRVCLCADVIMPPFQMKYIIDYVFMFQLKTMDFACIAQLKWVFLLISTNSDLN